MELKQLKVFLNVCDTMNITETAKQLSYSQSTISDIIQKLEASLETQLFLRVKKRIILTDKGKLLKTYAEKMMTLEQEAISDMRDNKKTIHVGITESLCAYKFPSFFREYLLKHPNININFEIARCETIPVLLKSHDIDFGITLDEPVMDDDIISNHLFEEEILFIKSTEYHKKAFNSYEALNDENIILSKGYTGYNKLFFDLYKEKQLSLGPITYMESIEGIKTYVKSGFGITFIPLIAIEKEIENNEITPIYFDDHHHFHSVQILTHRHVTPDKDIESLITACKNTFRV